MIIWMHKGWYITNLALVHLLSPHTKRVINFISIFLSIRLKLQTMQYKNTIVWVEQKEINNMAQFMVNLLILSFLSIFLLGTIISRNFTQKIARRRRIDEYDLKRTVYKTGTAYFVSGVLAFLTMVLFEISDSQGNFNNPIVLSLSWLLYAPLCVLGPLIFGFVPFYLQLSKHRREFEAKKKFPYSS